MEGLGLAFVEAMCARRPVVAHRSHHFEWLVGDEGCLEDLSVSGNLAMKIEKLLNDNRTTQAMVEANYARCVQNFDWAVLKNRYVEMYERVHSGHGRPLELAMSR